MNHGAPATGRNRLAGARDPARGALEPTSGAAALGFYHPIRCGGYVSAQSPRLVNLAECRRAGLRVGKAIIEGTADFPVNRRMKNSQQMWWSRRIGDLPFQARCGNYKGTLGSDFGQIFN
jgi:hypothetical protein